MSEPEQAGHIDQRVATLEDEQPSTTYRAEPPLLPPATRAMKFQYATGSRPLDGYTIKRGIGLGGFGEVYYAISDAGKQVAIKRVLRNVDIELRGVTQCINLKHLNLVELYDIRYDDQGDGWVVMEYVAGESLKELLDRNPNGMPIGDVVSWFRGIAKGVDYLHDHGIVHRDLKPANVFNELGVVKLGDYGLSKFISSNTRSQNTEQVGTFHYMAPEIGRGAYGKEIDIYALGVILFEMATGRIPFDGESSQEIIMRHLTDVADTSRLPGPLAKIVDRALRKDPKMRFRNVEEMLAMLERHPLPHLKIGEEETAELPTIPRHLIPESTELVDESGTNPAGIQFDIDATEEPVAATEVATSNADAAVRDAVEDHDLAEVEIVSPPPNGDANSQTPDTASWSPAAKEEAAPFVIDETTTPAEATSNAQSNGSLPPKQNVFYIGGESSSHANGSVAQPVAPQRVERNEINHHATTSADDAINSDEMQFSPTRSPDSSRPSRRLQNARRESTAPSSNHGVAEQASLGRSSFVRWWQESKTSVPVKMCLLIAVTIAMVLGGEWALPAGLAVGVIAGIYYALRSLAVWVSRRDRPAPTPAEENEQRMRAALGQKESFLSELVLNLIFATGISAVLALIWLVFGGVNLVAAPAAAWMLFALLFVAMAVPTWTILSFGRLWESSPGNSLVRRCALFAAGFAIGGIVFGVSLALGSPLAHEAVPSIEPALASLYHPSFRTTEVMPTLPAALFQFAFLLGLMHWWRQSDTLRPRRFHLRVVLLAMAASLFLPFPQPWGMLIAAGISIAVQLAATFANQTTREDLLQAAPILDT